MSATRRSPPRLVFVRSRVLIVDDSIPIRTALRWMVKQQGWDVCGEASNGAEGVSAAAQLKPDVVVLDFCMPVMNGIVAAVEIKKLIPEAHLLMFTSYAGPTIEEAARSAGIEAFVEKGDRTKFLQTLHRFESTSRKASVGQ